MKRVGITLTTSVDERRAHDAFAVHAALCRCERELPSLRDNPQWTLLRQDAFERFATCFEILI